MKMIQIKATGEVASRYFFIVVLSLLALFKNNLRTRFSKTNATDKIKRTLLVLKNVFSKIFLHIFQPTIIL